MPDISSSMAPVDQAKVLPVEGVTERLIAPFAPLQLEGLMTALIVNAGIISSTTNAISVEHPDMSATVTL